MSNQNKIIMHLDMNSYFASVEQQANPLLRGRAVGVCSYLSPNGVIIASSREAKAKGIKTGTKVREAKLLDPEVVLLENEPSKYRSTTEVIFNILREYSEKVEPYSIDEAFTDLTGYCQNFAKAEETASLIQERIKNEAGEWLNCSIGLSFTKWLAKFAGDIAPKTKILIIGNEDELRGVLKDRPLQDAWGINTRMEIRLKQLGIKNLLDLRNYDKHKIKKALGWYGYYLWANVNGEEITSVEMGTKAPKSIGHSYCIPKRTRDKNYLSAVFYKLCEKTGRRLRGDNLEAGQIHIAIAYVRYGGIHRSFRVPGNMFTTDEIFEPVKRFLEETNLSMPARMLAVSVGTLSPLTKQMKLFENNLALKKLSQALDSINNKYGDFTVYKGRLFNTEEVARDRIGFRKIR